MNWTREQELKSGVRKSDLSAVFYSAFYTLVFAVIWWLLFNYVFGAPTWGAWAVAVLYTYNSLEGDWGRLIAKRTV